MPIGLSVGNALTTNGSGLGNGIDITSMVESALAPMQQPITALEDQQTTLSQEAQILAAINSGLQMLHTDVQQFTNIDGAFSAKTATSSDTSQLTATANPLASAGTHTIVVTNLASKASYGTDTTLADSKTTFATGTFNITVGSKSPVAVTVNSSNNTIGGLADTINNLNLGITATVYTDAKGAHLSMVSNNSGTANDFTISGNTSGINFNKGATGANAQLTVDGISIDSTSNTINTVIPGVTLNLTNADKTPVTLTVAPDVSSMTSAVSSFVSDYNTVIKAINNQFVYDSTSGSALSPLQGDTNLQLLQQQLFNNVSFAMPGNSGVVNLESLGISMGNDGTLTVNSSTLANQISSNSTAVSNFFQGSSGSWGQKFNKDLYNLTNTTTGILNVEIVGINNSKTSISAHIADMQANLATQKTALTAQFVNVNTILEELPYTLASITSQLSGLKG